MRSNIIDLFTAEHLPINRCYDGIIILWPVNTKVEVQQSIKTFTLDNKISIINHNEIFQLKKNDKTIMLYIASDWFLEKGFDFFNRAFNTQLIQSVGRIEKSMLVLLKHYLEGNLTDEILARYLEVICDILIDEASVNQKHLSAQLTASLNDRDRELVEFIHNQITDKLTLESMYHKFFISQTAISGHINRIFNMGFKKYVETLRLGLSMASLTTTKKTISNIVAEIGFSSISLYSRKFKQYLEITPNKYRQQTKFTKNMRYIVQDFNDKLSQEGQTNYLSCIKSQLENWEDGKENLIYIDELKPRFFPTSPFVITLHIHTIDELKNLLVYNKYQEVLDFDKEALLLIEISICEIYQALQPEEIISLLNRIYVQNLNVSFLITSKEDVDCLQKEILTAASLKVHPSYGELKSESSPISFTFSLKCQDIKEIYVQILRIQELGIDVKYNLEITQLFNHPEDFKYLETRLKRVNFEYYFIDNADLDYLYLEKEYDNLPFKQVAEFTQIKTIMEQMHLEDRKYILVNIPDRKLLNDDTSIMESTPLMMYMFMQFYGALSGIGFDLNHQEDSNSVYLYDKNGFKTTLYFLYQQLSDFDAFYFCEDKSFLITEDDKRYTLMVYDWRVIENEIHQTNQSSHRYDLTFKDESLKRNFLVTREITDYRYGNINEIISPSILHSYHWSDYLKRKIESVNYPKFDVFNHDFRVGCLTINVKFNSLQLISLYKTKTEL